MPVSIISKKKKKKKTWTWAYVDQSHHEFKCLHTAGRSVNSSLGSSEVAEADVMVGMKLSTQDKTEKCPLTPHFPSG